MSDAYDTDPALHADAFEEGPEIWFDKTGQIWFGHDCVDGAREYTLVRAVYDITSESPLTIRNPVTCGRCGLKGRVIESQWVDQSDLK